MDVAHSSSPTPQVTDNRLPSAEDAAPGGPLTPEPAHHPSEASYDRDRKPSLQEILETTSTTMNFISTITTIFDEKGDQTSHFREGKRAHTVT